MGKCEICKGIFELDKHHIQSKSLGGDDQPYNLIGVCPNCHRQVHRGDIVVIGKFLTLEGYKVLTRKGNGSKLILDEPETYIITKKPTD
jgi:predicted HNH restriction endonuclease